MEKLTAFRVIHTGRLKPLPIVQAVGGGPRLSGDETESESLPKTAHGVTLRILRRPDLIAFAMRSQNWAQIVPYRVSFMRHADGRLDISVVRAALFELLAEGRVVAPDLDFAPLGLDTVFRTSTS